VTATPLTVLDLVPISSGSTAAQALRNSIDLAQAAERLGLRFAANYHVSPATVIEAAEGYRAAFRPSADLARPYLSVSADVVVASSSSCRRRPAPTS